MTRKILAQKLKVSSRTIFRLEKKGFPVFYIGTLPRYNYGKVMEWVAENSYLLKGGK